MQSLNLVLTEQYILYQSHDFSPDETIVELVQPAPDIFAHLSELLFEIDLPRNTPVNLILDHSFIRYVSFSLPPVTRRKLDKILHYELADVLIEEIDLYSYGYRFNCRENEAHIGVYLLRKEFIQSFIHIGKAYNLEIRKIFALNDLLDCRLRERYSPENEIIVTADRYKTRVIAYKNSFVIGFSNQPTPFCSDDTHLINGYEEPQALEELNWKIKAIGFKERALESIRISDESKPFLILNNESELHIERKNANSIPASVCLSLLPLIQTNRTKLINLLKSNTFLLAEAKKHIKKITILLALLSIGGVLYISSLIYQNLERNNQYRHLKNIHLEIVNRYLPRGTPANKAIQTLEEQVNELKKQNLQNIKFGRRSYPITKQLSTLSKIKQQVPSLLLTRFYLTDQSIRIQGEVSSFTAYDKMKSSLEAIYPKEYSLKYNQKSVGDGIIEFSVIIRPE